MSMSKHARDVDDAFDDVDELNELDEHDTLDTLDEHDAALDETAQQTRVAVVWNDDERAAFDALYASHVRFLRFATQRVGASDAEDIVADLWARLARRWPTIYATTRSSFARDRASEPRELERYAWRALRHLLAAFYRHHAMVERRAPTVSLNVTRVSASRATSGETSSSAASAASSAVSSERFDVAAPSYALSNPDQALLAQDTLARILRHCSPAHREIVLLLAQSLDMSEVRAALAARGITYKSHTAPRMAMMRLAARLAREEPDIDVAGRNPLKRL